MATRRCYPPLGLEDRARKCAEALREFRRQGYPLEPTPAERAEADERKRAMKEKAAAPR